MVAVGGRWSKGMEEDIPQEGLWSLRMNSLGVPITPQTLLGGFRGTEVTFLVGSPVTLKVGMTKITL